MKEEDKLRSSRPTCTDCYRPKKACFCRYLSKIDTHARFVLLMHPTEIKKGHIGTGRYTHLGLPNSEILVGTSFQQHPKLKYWLNSEDYYPIILYPKEDSIDLKSTLVSHEYKSKTPIIFIIDATWPRAKQIIRNTPILHSLPAVSIDIETESIFSIKQQPDKKCLSTIESVQQLILNLVEQNLEEIPKSDLLNFTNPLKKLVEFHQNLASDPKNNNYKRLSSPASLPNQRRPSKKWQERSICFKL